MSGKSKITIFNAFRNKVFELFGSDQNKSILPKLPAQLKSCQNDLARQAFGKTNENLINLI
jgi:hypothetical protein